MNVWISLPAHILHCISCLGREAFLILGSLFSLMFHFLYFYLFFVYGAVSGSEQMMFTTDYIIHKISAGIITVSWFPTEAYIYSRTSLCGVSKTYILNMLMPNLWILIIIFSGSVVLLNVNMWEVNGSVSAAASHYQPPYTTTSCDASLDVYKFHKGRQEQTKSILGGF